MRMKALVATVAVIIPLTVASGGCNPRMAGTLLGAAIVTAAIVGTARIMADHDAHFHDEYCGHARRWHRGRWVYHYGGHWEYHHGGRWYYY